MKSQIVIDEKNSQILWNAQGKGKKHDFNLFKNSKMLINHQIEIIGDKGYQGINKIHKNSQIPFKKFPKKELTQAQKKSNKQLGKKRVIVENVIGKLKIFKILSSSASIRAIPVLLLKLRGS
ncbi:MAG: transposase [Gomphosphaeria aponina SAG 52.96 = DSM 107014]|uniref:Transposase n=1 Tax=Gomphosphaeria aponina SAG 52.96 = DSM 107014 TaxID=1521640 RepID=A0A941GWG2_9CHRO|nr:transposase [Gomphosphaeria aponina SAG 52.96 = DSM 107014]